LGVVYLTLDQVLRYHEKALAVAPGGEGLRSYERLAAAVSQAKQTFGEQDLYPTIPEKAAAYGFFIAENQAFVDGNKRTASIAMLAFLYLNGHEFYQTDAEIEEMLVAVGDENSTIDQGEFFGWVCNHAKPKPTGSC
jgi:death-on-curing protein